MKFLQLGDVAEDFIKRGAAAGVSTLPSEIAEIVSDVVPAYGAEAVVGALGRATRFGRFRAVDVRSILAAGVLPDDVAPGEHLDVDLPGAQVRSLDAYRIEAMAQ